MFKRSVKNTILLNIGAFLLVLVLEILSIWTVKEKFETEYAFYLHGFSYALLIMLVIWVNHFALIPFFLDKKRYVLYGILLIGSIFLGSYLRGYGSGGWRVVSKFFLDLSGTFVL